MIWLRSERAKVFSWPGDLSDHGDPVCPSMAGRAGSCPARSWCEAFSGVLGTVSRSISHKLLEVDWKCAELLGLGRLVSRGVPRWPVLLNIFIHDLGDGERAPSASLWTVPSQEEWLYTSGTVLPSRGTWAGWRNGQRNLMEFNQGNAKSCPGRGITPGPGTCWRAALRRRSWQSRWEGT